MKAKMAQFVNKTIMMEEVSQWAGSAQLLVLVQVIATAAVGCQFGR